MLTVKKGERKSAHRRTAMAFFCTLKQALTIQTEVNCKTFIKKREEGAIEIRMLIIKMCTEGFARV